MQGNVQVTEKSINVELKKKTQTLSMWEIRDKYMEKVISRPHSEISKRKQTKQNDGIKSVYDIRTCNQSIYEKLEGKKQINNI